MSTSVRDYVSNQPRSTVDLARWLALAPVSPVIDPGLPIVDPHHHLFGNDGDVLFYRLEDLRNDLAMGHRVVGTVYVEAYESGWRNTGPEEMRPVGEVEMIEALTREPLSLPTGPCHVAAAIVGHADLARGARVDAVLDALEEAARGRLQGIRHRTASVEGPVGRVGLHRPAPHMLVDREFQEGVRRLGQRGLTFDAWAYHTQLGEVAALADAAPGTTIVVDHVAGPIGVEEFRTQREEVMRAWLDGLRALALRPNIRMKIGGMGMPLYGFDLYRGERPPSDADVAAAWRPLIETCIGIFGTARCMFESNFPVDKQSLSYLTLWNAFKIVAQGATRSEKRDLFYATACRTYGLDALSNVADKAW